VKLALPRGVARMSSRITGGMAQQLEEQQPKLAGWRLAAESLHEMMAILNSNRPLSETLDYIITEICQRLHAPAGALYRLSEKAVVLDIQAAYGLEADDAALNLPLTWGATGQAVLQRQPVMTTDNQIVFTNHLITLLSPHELARLMRLQHRYPAVLAVPLIVKDTVYGALALYYDAPKAFGDAEVRLAVGLSAQAALAFALSAQAALAIENARLVALAQQEAILEERQRLARDLHDSITQALYGITLYAGAATLLLSSGDRDTVAAHLFRLENIAQEALREMRLLIFELRSPILEQEGLVAALQARLEAVEGRANLKTTFVVSGVGALPPLIEQALYRIAQEALNNVLKHAHAQTIQLSLRQEQATLILEISDDGVGFDESRVRATRGLGLRGIVERVAQLGGRLTMRSTPGAGTQIQVEVVL
jgi:signal transduction histidine kinase